MPFLQENGSVEANLVVGRIGSALPTASLVVDPDQVLTLKHGIEEEYARIQEWLVRNGNRLSTVQRPGTDPCSTESVDALSENGEAAQRAAQGYLLQLASVGDALGEIARAYQQAEAENAGKLGGRPK
jgi:hypothetical protein